MCVISYIIIYLSSADLFSPRRVTYFMLTLSANLFLH